VTTGPVTGAGDRATGGATSFPADRGRAVVDALIATIDAHAQELSDIDGAIGDGDHGVNMRKGFLLARDRLGETTDLSDGLAVIGDVLLGEIGGAMGPLYGTFFGALADSCRGALLIDAETVRRMLDTGLAEVTDLGGAQVGDKTLVDVLAPAVAAYDAAVDAGEPFGAALAAMAAAAERGKESTRDLVARLGRASRLGERSRGVLDAGATSCCLLLDSMASAMRRLLAPGA
jgi:dihydroxyacetone kinase-like protein